MFPFPVSVFYPFFPLCFSRVNVVSAWTCLVGLEDSTARLATLKDENNLIQSRGGRWDVLSDLEAIKRQRP